MARVHNPRQPTLLFCHTGVQAVSYADPWLIRAKQNEACPQRRGVPAAERPNQQLQVCCGTANASIIISAVFLALEVVLPLWWRTASDLGHASSLGTARVEAAECN